VALAHGGGAALGYGSTVTNLEPPALGVFVEVKDGDDRLALSNTTGKTLLVEGYEGEPYLRFEPDGVYRNRRSPATYLNEERFGGVRLPAEADGAAEPSWEKVGDGTTYEWHDHRIHWMSADAPPPVVREAPDEPHHVLDWEVPAVLDGKPLAIRGSLDYVPPEDDGLRWVYFVPPVLALLVAGGAWVVLRRRPTAA
jgi:hypothetical protein